MLKNKKAVYLLIPLNLFIWGFFIYRFYTAYNDSDLPVPGPAMQALKVNDIKDSATYTLKLDYKDPFLKGVERSFVNTEPGNNPPVPVQKKVMPVATPTVAPKQLPDVKYLGLIKNNNSGLTTALVSVNGQSKLIRPNESVDGITFKSFNKDSLVARWGKEKIVVRR